MSEIGTVRIGVVGCAEFARRRMIPAFRRDPGVEVVAVASRDAGKARAYAEECGCEPVTGYDGLLARADIDAVYVPVPAALHHVWVACALDAGKHVLAEKPLATTAAAAAELVDLARRRGLVLMENVMFVHHSQHRAVREMVANGDIGAVRGFRAVFGIPPRPGFDIRYRPDLGGGALFDLGVYPVRAAGHVLGARLELIGACARVPPETGVDVAGTALLATPAGVPAELSYGMEHAYRSAYTIWGSAGHITLDHAFTPPADRVPVPRVTTGRETRDVRLPPDDQVANTIRAFARKIAAGDTAGADLDATLRQCALLDEIRTHNRCFGRTEE